MHVKILDKKTTIITIKEKYDLVFNLSNTNNDLNLPNATLITQRQHNATQHNATQHQLSNTTKSRSCNAISVLFSTPYQRAGNKLSP